MRATEEGIEKMKEAKEAIDQSDLGEDSDIYRKPLTNQFLAEKALVSISTVKRFFGGKNIHRSYATAILEVLNLDIRNIISD